MPDTILVDTAGRVGLITLNRPAALNALSTEVARELVAALTAFDADEGIGCTVIEGSDRAFAAGADIRELAGFSHPDVAAQDPISVWDGLATIRKPVIAAVAGVALGGGCELALACDLIVAADTARFGQPEIRLGLIPGIGGTQRLVRAVGKAVAMDMILSGRTLDASEAERCGLVARVVQAAELKAASLALAETIAAMPLQALLAAKQSVGRAFEVGLEAGIRAERQDLYALFATHDAREGLSAFLDKRQPGFRHR